MMSLFSSFDLFMFNSQKIFLFFMALFLSVGNFKFSFFKNFVKKIFMFFLDFFNSIKSKSQKFFYSMNIFLFLMIFMLNFSSLNSYVFSFTSQLSLVLMMSMTFWGFMFIFMIFKNFKYFISHFVPVGTPMYLVIFLFLIEMISNLIRFITLTVRLTANILAGHLLVILLSKMVLSNIFIFPIFIALNSVEIFVSLIQSYIFCTMICLYYSEIE